MARINKSILAEKDGGPFAVVVIWPLFLLMILVMFGPSKISSWLVKLIDNLFELPFAIIAVTDRWQKIRKSNLQSKPKLRDKLKYLLLGTWGQSILGAPLWTWLLGWKFAALNIVLSWSGWKFGRQALIDKYKDAHASKTPAEAIENIHKFKSKELDSKIKSFNDLKHAILKTIAEIDSRIREIKSRNSYTQASPLQASFKLRVTQLDRIAEDKREKLEKIKKALEVLNTGDNQLQQLTELLQLDKFIEDINPQGTDDTSETLIADAYVLMEACRRIIQQAESSDIRSLAADPSISIDEIAERADQAEETNQVNILRNQNLPTSEPADLVPMRSKALA